MNIDAGRLSHYSLQTGAKKPHDGFVFPSKSPQTEESLEVISLLENGTRELQQLELNLTQMRLDELNKLMALQTKLTAGFGKNMSKALLHDSIQVGKALQNIGKHLEQISNRGAVFTSAKERLSNSDIFKNYEATALNHREFSYISTLA